MTTVHTWYSPRIVLTDRRRGEVYMSNGWGDLIHTQCLSFLPDVELHWWAWTLTPPVVPEGGAS